MEPSIVAAFGAAMAVGIAGSEVVKHFLGNRRNGNGKVEMLLGRLVELAADASKQDTDVSQTLAMIQKDLENHEKRESQAWRDAFALLRKEQ